MNENTDTSQSHEAPDLWLFWGCFIALIATAFGFILRALLLDEWAIEFNLTNTQLGEIAGVGLWPFAISIVIFSLFIDKVGYKTAMIFAFICQIASAFITIFATGYTMLYVGTFILALGNGSVEAFANPVVTTIFSKDKTKWLNILHAGWAGGLAVGGLFALLLGPAVSWEIKIGLILIPVLIYGVILIGRKFPIQERVKAGVSYLDMLKEVGIGGALIIVGLIVFQIGDIFVLEWYYNVIITIAIVGVFGFYVRSFGQPLFVFLLLIMILSATTELGTDSWITSLMEPAMADIGLQAGWILVYTSAIMVVLRFFTGQFVKVLTPVGLLAVCSGIAALGLYLLSGSTGIAILVAATVYGLGKTFFWPTMLGVVAERFPKGGALTLNITGGVGMIGVGIIGAVILGFVQDKAIDKGLSDYDAANNTELHAQFVTVEKKSIFGDYMALDNSKLASATETDAAAVGVVQQESKKDALRTVIIFPLIMLIFYGGLFFYFRSQGGYKAVELEGGSGHH